MPSGGPRPGAGRPPGSKNKTAPLVKELARKYTSSAIETLVQLAGFAEVQELDPKTKKPLFNEDGTPKMKRLPPASSEMARISAIQILLDRGWGKATQMVAGDENEAPIITVTKVEVEAIQPGSPLFGLDEEEDDQRVEH